MLNVHLPQPLYGQHTHERLITADCTRAGQTVHLYPAHYPDFAAPVDAVTLRVGGQILKAEVVGAPETLAYAYTLPQSVAPETAVEIWLHDQFAGRVVPRALPLTRKVTLTAATLFKNDYTQLETWVDYHAALGFERFVLYFNGELARILPEVAACAALRDRDVLLVPWPFAYWAEGLGLGAEGLIAVHGAQADLSQRGRDWHHAQQLMLNHALVVLRGTTDYLCFFDLDEYFRPATGVHSLADLCRHHGQDVYIFQSRWAELPGSEVPAWGDDRHFFDRHPVLAAPEWVPFPSRTKYIARPECIASTGAHVPKATMAGTRMVKVEPEVVGLYHFHCFSGKAPRRNLITPGGVWAEVPGFLPQGMAAEAATV